MDRPAHPLVRLPETRIGDDERHACIQSLGEHHARGRLTPEEFDTRVDAALRAHTRGELERLVVDLPGDLPLARQASRGPETWLRHIRAEIPPLGAVGFTAAFAHFALDSETTGPWVFSAALGSGLVGVVIGRVTTHRRQQRD